MPQFELNAPSRKAHPFYSLDTFARGYVEAMFFTNCDCGSEDEFIANRLGVERLTHESVAAIAADCADFQETAAPLLEMAYSCGYDEEQAGADFWFTRQGHGVGFWDRDVLDCVVYRNACGSIEIPADSETDSEMLADGAQPIGNLGRALSRVAKDFGERYVEICGGWIRY